MSKQYLWPPFHFSDKRWLTICSWTTSKWSLCTFPFQWETVTYSSPLNDIKQYTGAVAGELNRSKVVKLQQGQDGDSEAGGPCEGQEATDGPCAEAVLVAGRQDSVHPVCGDEDEDEGGHHGGDLVQIATGLAQPMTSPLLVTAHVDSPGDGNDIMSPLVLHPVVSEFSAIKRQSTASSSVHVMAWCQFGTKPSPEPMLTYCQLEHKNKV